MASKLLFLPPRGRVTVFVVLGLPLLLTHAAAQIVPYALSVDTLWQPAVFRRVLEVRIVS